MQVTITVPDMLVEWARTQVDLNTAIIDILVSHAGRHQTSFEVAAAKLRDVVRTVPQSLEFTIQDAIGFEVWSTLDKQSRLSLGKHVKANAASFGVRFLRKNSANHAIYERI